jgi:hypothetical protein
VRIEAEVDYFAEDIYETICRVCRRCGRHVYSVINPYGGSRGRYIVDVDHMAHGPRCVGCEPETLLRLR